MKRFSSPSKIKVGIVGYGSSYGMGGIHLKEMAKAGMTPVAIADTDPARQKAAGVDFPGIETYSSLSEMLKKSSVNLITMITPHNTHAKLVVQAVRAGRHVVCEKPLAITTAECDAMIAAAKKSGVIVSAYHNRHWDGCILQAVDKIRAGVIGDVVRVEGHMGGYGKPTEQWRSSKSISGGVLYDWGVHVLEYALQIIDSQIAEVSGFAHNGYWAPKMPWKKDTNEDEGFAVVRFAGGAWLSLMISSIDSNPKPGVLEIMGTKGTYIMNHPTWETITRKGSSVVSTKGKNPPGETWRYYQNIADYLVKGTKLVITPEWARRPIHILDLACRSAEKGKAMPAQYK